MAMSIENMHLVRAVNPPIFMAYGKHGVGKTSFGNEWPNPIFLQCEQGEGNDDLPTFGVPETFDDVLSAMRSMLIKPHDRKTLVLDTLDAMEPMIWRHVCEPRKWDSPSSPGYGEGWVLVDEPWRLFFKGCKALKKAGIGVVLLAHSEERTFNSPTTDPYDRYTPKLHKRAAAICQEESDIVGFFDIRVIVKKNTDGGFKKTRAIGSGERVIYLEERPGQLAKNRYQMPESVDYPRGGGYDAIKAYFPQPTGIVPKAA